MQLLCRNSSPVYVAPASFRWTRNHECLKSHQARLSLTPQRVVTWKFSSWHWSHEIMLNTALNSLPPVISLRVFLGMSPVRFCCRSLTISWTIPSKLASGSFAVSSDVVGVASIITSAVRSFQTTLPPAVSDSSPGFGHQFSKARA